MPDQLDRIRRLPERSKSELDDLYAVLDDGHHVGTLATVVDGEPWVVPMLYARVGDRLFLHGSSAAGALRNVAGGARVALGVTHMDGLVYAHTMFNQSALFRSAVVRGSAAPVAPKEKADALTAMTEAITPGRPAEMPSHTKKQLAATQILQMDLRESSWTVKVRDGFPTPPEPGEVVSPDLWRGVVPIRSVFTEPVAAPGVKPGTAVSPSIQRIVEASH